MMSELAYGYAKLGHNEDATRIFNELEVAADELTIGAGTWALSYLAVTEADKSLVWLNTAARKVETQEIDEGFLPLMFIKANMYSDPVLEEPRFIELRNKLGIID